MKNTILLLANLLLISNLFAQEFIPLWPEGKMPNSKGLPLEHKEENQLISEVNEPGIYSFFPSNRDNSGTAVLICPPGGYAKLAYNIAGFQFAKWLNTIGVNAFVLIHRLPNSPDLITREEGPIQDAQRALKIIRANAAKWDIDTSKIGTMGASAGGHLAATLGTHFQDYSNIGDSLDNMSIETHFMILISPMLIMHKDSAKNLLGDEAPQEKLDLFSCEKHVSEKTPPAFLVHAQNDHVVSVMNSISFYEAMIENNVTGSLHIFPKGKHSIALRNKATIVNQWPDLCERWLKEIGALAQ